MARLIGEAYIVVYPQTDLFAEQTETGIKNGLAALKPEVTVQPKLDKTATAAVKAQLKAMGSDVEVTPELDAGALAKLKTQLDALLKNQKFDVDPEADPAKLAAVKKSIDEALKGATAKVDLDAAGADSALEELASRVGDLRIQLANLRASVDNSAAIAKIAALDVQATKLSRALTIAPVTADLAPFEAQLLGIIAAYDKVQAAQDKEDQELVKQSGLWGSLGLSGPGSLIHITDILNASLPEVKLFDGAIGNLYKTLNGNELPSFANHLVNVATSAHLTTEAAVEFIAIWGPALLGLTAFAIAAAPAVYDIGVQLRNIEIVAHGTGAEFANLNTQQSKLAQAVKPQVMQLFGDYLLAAGQNGDHLAKVLTAIGTVLDNFGAKIVQALSSDSTSKFLDKAASDIQGLGVAFTQVGRIIGDLLKDVPGYAEILLKLGDAALTVGANIVGAINPVIAIFLKLHGAVLYIGLATTALAAFARGATNAFVAVSGGGEKVTETSGLINGLGVAVGNMGGKLASAAGLVKNYVAEIGEIGKESGAAAAAGTVFGDALEALPFGPVGLAVGVATALIGVGLYAALHQAASAADQLATNMTKLISGSNIVNVQSNIAEAAQKTTAQINAQAKTVDALTEANRKTGDAVVNLHTGDYTAFGKALETTTSQIGTNQAELSKYADLNATAAVRINQLGNAYGDTAAQSQLLTLAGVKQSDVANANADAWALDLIKIQATAEAYGLMGQQAGAAGNQLDTLTISTGQVTKAVGTLVSAEQAWIALITGGDSAFTTFEQGFDELKSAMSKASDGGATLTVKVGNLKDKFTEAGASMNGTSQASLAVRQAFDAQITSAGALYGNLQTLAAASGNNTAANAALAKSGKDIVAQLLPLAAGSKEATSEVYALAQVVGFTGPDSFSKLVQWVGNTKNAEKDLDAQQAQLTESSATLSTAAKNLSGALQNTVTVMQGQALLATSGFTNAQNTLINTLHQTQGQLSATADTAAIQYYEALVKAGVGTKQARDDTDALLQKLNVEPGAINDVNAQLDKLNTKYITAGGSTNALSNASNTLATAMGGLVSSGQLTTDKMNTLTNAIITNKGHVDDSHTAFDNLATGLGLSRDAADKLWSSLKSVTGTYSAQVNATISASGIVNAVQTSGAAANIKNALLGSLAFSAEGGIVHGKGPAGRDSVPTMLAPGELVVPTAHVPKFADMARKASIPGMAAGGLVALEPSVAATIQNVAPKAVQDEAPFSHDTVNAFVADIIKAYQASMQGTPGNVSSYKGVVDTVLGLLGQPLSDDVIVLRQMATESGGNPTAVNNSDINAQNGVPSTGLMQVIGPTFAAYAGPFANTGPFLNGVSTNPEANIYAALNYAVHRYGTSWTSVLGAGHGYAAGGIVKPFSAGGMVSEPVFGYGARSGMPYSFAENGPEYVGPISGGQAGNGGGSHQSQQIIKLLQDQNKLLAQMPYSQAKAINQANGSGVRRGYFATSG